MAENYNMQGSYTFSAGQVILSAWGTAVNLNLDDKISKTDPTVQSIASDLTVTGALNATLNGDVTGDVTGDLTGNVTGNITGQILGTSSLSAWLVPTSTGTSAITDTNFNETLTTDAEDGTPQELVSVTTLKKVLKTSTFGLSGNATATSGVDSGDLYLQWSPDGTTFYDVGGQTLAIPGTDPVAFNFTDTTNRISALGETISYRLDYRNDTSVDNVAITSASVTEANYSIGWGLER